MNEPGVSLSGLRLHLREGLDCPDGGYHVVPLSAVEAARSLDVPTNAACIKCKSVLTLQRTD